MLNSAILETAIGLVFVYLIFSLIASAIAEYFSALLDRRGEHLKHILFNLFDNDDPQGQAFLNLFVSHPMVQALNSTDWKPTFQSAEQRIEEGAGKLKLAGTRWALASQAVAAATAAGSAARKASEAAAAATTAGADVTKAQKSFDPANAATAAMLQSAVAAAEAAASRAEAAAGDAQVATAAANRASLAASTAASRAGSEPDPVSVAAEPPIAAPDVPAAAAATDFSRRAEDAVRRTALAAAAAKKAAAEARKAAAVAEKTKRGLYSQLIGLVQIPRYIPDRTFADVVVQVLTSDDTFGALGRDEQDPAMGVPVPASTGNPFWVRFSAAVVVVRGVTSRLPDSDADAKAKVQRALDQIDESLKHVDHNVAEAAAVFTAVARGTDELRGAIAAIPDDGLRGALEREMETSLRPLLALGADIVRLQRAAQTVALMAESSMKTAISAFLDQAGEDMEAFKKSVASWFNDVMDHATGWYKRNTQRILVLIALVLCSVNNVDTVSLVSRLSTDPSLRAAAGKEARFFLEPPPSAADAAVPAAPEGHDPAKLAASGSGSPDRFKAALDATRLPLWWTQEEWTTLWYSARASRTNGSAVTRPAAAHIASSPTGPRPGAGDGKSSTATPKEETATNPGSGFAPDYSLLLSKITGLTLSILAVSMGAPFWFDVLNKLINVRLVGKRPDPTVVNPPP